MDRIAWLKVKKKKAIERYNEIFAPIYDQRWGAVLDKTHVSFVGELADKVGNGARILDIACGTGKYWPLLMERGVKVTGVDQSAEMLSSLKSKHETAIVYEQSLQNLKLGARFDAVMCIDAMENVPPEDWPLVLERFSEHLVPAGWLYFTVEIESKNEIEQAYKKAQELGLPVVYGEVALEGYHFYPSRDAVQQWVGVAGLEICKETVGDGYWHLLCRKP